MRTANSTYSNRFGLFSLSLLLFGTLTSAGLAEQIKLDVALANPTMLIEEADKGENYLRIALTGFDIPNKETRQPVNVAIVIDKSGSMQGEKIRQARKAAIGALERLGDDDILSIITYDSTVHVLVPATKASDRELIRKKIESIKAGGNTALFAGVSKGAAEIRKFLDEKTVNRVILLSDGLANVGPSTPSELAQLGESLIKEGISVSTLGLGLGYNEDLMSRMAVAGNGNHVFIEDAENLVSVFQNEFDDVLSVVAQQIRIVADIAPGVRPVKVLNSKADITGQQVAIDLGQLYAKQERYFVLEVEVPFAVKGTAAPVAEVAVEYMNMLTETKDKLTSAVEVKFTDDKTIAINNIDKPVFASCMILVANGANKRATELRDAGQINAACNLLQTNAAWLDKQYQDVAIPELKSKSLMNRMQSENLFGNWATTRKAMREAQVADDSQQRYSGSGAKTPSGSSSKGSSDKKSNSGASSSSSKGKQPW
ncbi:MAG: VWA domain-containing protein [Pirellulaceae bacterium]